MSDDQRASLTTIWENLNAIRFDIEQGNPEDALTAIDECEQLLRDLGIQ